MACGESGRGLLLEVGHRDPHPRSGGLSRSLLQEGRGTELVLSIRVHLSGKVRAIM